MLKLAPILTVIAALKLKVIAQIKLDASVDVSVRQDPARAIRSLGKDLPPEVLAECATRAPSAAIEYVGKDLPPEVLAECATREPYAAIVKIGKDLPPEVLAECATREPYAAIVK
ncbi:MAG: hypothetical protein IT435_20675, partial [Phycisphaerales bacterium]|nr:hypothetical protein [Phycisphaerales bacterium]